MTEPIRPPLIFGVKNCRPVSMAGYEQGTFWMADVKAVRHAVQHLEFKDILFVEINGNAFVCGIEQEDGLSRDVPADMARKQQAFIHFVRNETQRDNAALGALAGLFEGHEFSNLACVTAAYIVARGTEANLGVGYHNRHGEYELVAIAAEGNAWIEDAQRMLPYDQIA